MTQLVHVSTTGKQNYGTPLPFVGYVGRRFGLDLILDLAADQYNRKCAFFLDEARDSLTVDWKAEIQKCDDLVMRESNDFADPAGWLNPPFKKNPQFGKKCHEEKDKGAKLATLKEHFKNNALNFILEDRMIFVGETQPYPKELMLSIWGTGMNGVCWLSYKKELEYAQAA